jgi:hypothetical protein
LKKAFISLDKKDIASIIGYSLAIAVVYESPIVSEIIYFAIAVMWIVPDKSIAEALKSKKIY